MYSTQEGTQNLFAATEQSLSAFPHLLFTRRAGDCTGWETTAPAVLLSWQRGILSLKQEQKMLVYFTSVEQTCSQQTV